MTWSQASGVGYVSRRASRSSDSTWCTGRKPKFYTGDIVYGYLRPYLNKVWVADLIETKGRGVTEAIAALRKML